MGEEMTLPSTRLLTKSQAAAYCGLSPATFGTTCSVRPISLGDGVRMQRYDVRDIDTWIDGFKGGIARRTQGEHPTWDASITSITVGAAFLRFRYSNEWARKMPRTREDWNRAWKYIEPEFSHLAPSEINFEDLDHWYQRLSMWKGVGEAGRAMKTWRALYNVMASMKLCPAGQDPSLAIRKKTVPGRTQTWQEGEVVRMVKHAWRTGYHGLACIVAVAWDTSFSPVDARSVTMGDAVDAGGDWGFLIKRGKTSETAFGILTPRVRRLVEAYISSLDYTLHDDAPIFRTKGFAPSGKGGRPRVSVPYTKDTLVDDFADLRRAVFGKEEKRRLMDMRRTGAVEATAGGASVETLSAKMGNSIDQNKTLQKTYMPVNLAAVRLADEARIKGRRRLASGHNEIKKWDS